MAITFTSGNQTKLSVYMFDGRFTILRYGDFLQRQIEEEGELFLFRVHDDEDGSEFTLTGDDATSLDSLIKGYMAGRFQADAVCSWLTTVINHLRLDSHGLS